MTIIYVNAHCYFIARDECTSLFLIRIVSETENLNDFNHIVDIHRQLYAVTVLSFYYSAAIVRGSEEKEIITILLLLEEIRSASSNIDELNKISRHCEKKVAKTRITIQQRP